MTEIAVQEQLKNNHGYFYIDAKGDISDNLIEEAVEYAKKHDRASDFIVLDFGLKQNRIRIKKTRKFKNKSTRF